MNNGSLKMVYLFVGQDLPSKDIQLKKLKNELLKKDLEQFNFDTLYGQELNLKALQEKLLSLPVNAQNRLIVIKDAQDLKNEIKDFLIEWAKNIPKHVILVLDIDEMLKNEVFIKSLQAKAKVFRFKETIPLNTFNLTKFIEQGRCDYSLRVLANLLEGGERPERILGGLRYAIEKNNISRLSAQRKLKVLLNCDLEIKTGKLKPAFALEKLVVSLCYLAKPFH